jgi:uncharacterized protein with HEPN domain
MKRNINLFIEDINDSIKNIEEFTRNITGNDFEGEVMVTRCSYKKTRNNWRSSQENSAKF